MQKKVYFCNMKHVRIISPSGAIDPLYIAQASARLQGWGFAVSEGMAARSQCGRFAGTDEERLRDLSEALCAPDADIILCARGGYGLQRIVDRLSVADPHGIVVGFSDITALHQWSLLHDRVSLHGLMCKHLAQLADDAEPLMWWRKAVSGEQLDYALPSHSLNRCGCADGILIGGNLSVLYGLQATPYSLLNVMREEEKYILFIEDIGERHYHIDRMMLNLKMSGVLARIGGLVVGQFTDCEDDAAMGCTVYETICKAVAEYDYPVLFDFPAGHIEYNLPIWLGKKTSVQVSPSSCRFIQ